MGIARDSRHKRRETGGKRKKYRKKRKFELGRQPAMTKLMGPVRVHPVRTRGGNKKFRALRLDSGNFSWGTEAIAKHARIVNVVYNASNNELVRTKTLVKGCIVQIDGHEFKSYFQARYGITLAAKKGDEAAAVTGSFKVKGKQAKRAKDLKIDPNIEEQFASGRILACISSRPGQCGRADGYILEGPELEFYKHKLATKKSKK